MLFRILTTFVRYRSYAIRQCLTAGRDSSTALDWQLSIERATEARAGSVLQDVWICRSFASMACFQCSVLAISMRTKILSL